MDAFLQAKLDCVARRYRWLAFWRILAACWAAAALIGAGIVALERWTGSPLPGAVPLVVLVGVGSALALAIVLGLRRPDYRWIARRIEAAYPELNGVLLTAVEQPNDDHAPDFLRHVVLRQAVARSQEQDWGAAVPNRRLAVIHAIHAAAVVCLLVALAALHRQDRAALSVPGGVRIAGNVVITPGDATLERGDTLVVLARFGRELPAGVTMTVRQSGAPARTVALGRNLGDPVFGTSVTNVQQDFTYQLEYGHVRSPQFTVTVFEHPRLVRADAAFVYPPYTRLAPRRIEDTTRLSAVEGTRVSLALQLNKRVTEARLVGHDAAKPTVKLTVDPTGPRATLPDWVPTATGTYDLVLIDAEGRKNKVTTRFVVSVQPNRRPELRLATPRGDLRPSPLEEIAFDGTVWDDFGTLAYGIAYTLPSGETKTVELGRNVAAGAKKSFKHQLNLEALGAAPDDLISWNLWADDIGPDGKVRHTSGDLYFGEVRAFDQVFRESQMPGGGGQQAGGGGSATQRLAQLQRQIVSATWNLRQRSASALEPAAASESSATAAFLDGAAPSAPRETGGDGAPPSKGKPGPGRDYASSADVIRQSQQQARSQADQAAQEVRSPRALGLWREATSAMETATKTLAAAVVEPSRLADALPPEQAAYRALLKVQAHETSVTRGQRGGGAGGAGQASQRQIDQLDLQQADNRYETQRQARTPQNRQQQEQLVALNRLQDLARRQQEVNERLNELQTALQEAKTEAEREQLRQRLKRLEDEQRQNLADADELRQRMDQSADPSALSQQRQELDRARDDLQRAADATGQGDVGQAVASGTRAERQLQDARDNLRKQSSTQLADDLRTMRGEARDLSRRQEELERRMVNPEPGAPQRKSLGGTGGDPALEQQVAEQHDRWNRLLDEAKQLSEQAETSEPLVSKHLYDGVRKAAQTDAASVSQLQQDLLGRGELTYDLRDRLQGLAASDKPGKALDLAREMLRSGNGAAAGESVHRATTEVDDLRQGVEDAADSVLGDDTEQLKLARSELEQLTDELQRDRVATPPSPHDAQASNTNRGTSELPMPDSSADGSRRLQDRRPTSQSDRKALAEGGSERRASDSRTSGSTAGAERRLQDRRPTSQSDRKALAEGGSERRASGSETDRAGDGRQISVDRILNGADGGGPGGGGLAFDRGRFGPLTGDDYARWTDRLRDVEQLLDSPNLRDAVATARERAQLLRRDYSQSHRKPDWAVVELQVVRPLVEVRQRIAEELARHDAKDSLAPIDHDPVPNRFAESVRRYYEELGRDSAAESAAQPH